MRTKSAPHTWKLRLYLGRDAQGRVKRKYATFVGGKRDAERDLARLSLQFESKPQLASDENTLWGSKTTFNDAILAWQKNGWQGYESYLDPLGGPMQFSIARPRFSTLDTPLRCCLSCRPTDTDQFA